MKALKTTIDFFSHESCGQCTPCREGTGWMNRIIHRITGGNGKVSDLDLLHDICNKMQGRTICALADAAAMPVRSYVEKFRPELEDFIRSGRKVEGFFTANGGH
jgi:NADH-quinone oxidoreductase subunit F